MYPLLNAINLPDDLRKLDRKQLPQLADELRAACTAVALNIGGWSRAGKRNRRPAKGKA